MIRAEQSVLGRGTCKRHPKTRAAAWLAAIFDTFIPHLDRGQIHHWGALRITGADGHSGVARGELATGSGSRACCVAVGNRAFAAAFGNCAFATALGRRARSTCTVGAIDAAKGHCRRCTGGQRRNA